MNNLLNKNEQWNGTITLSQKNTNTTFLTGGKYVDKDINLNIDIQDAIFTRAEQLNTNWEEIANIYEVKRSGYVEEGQQGIFYVPWYNFSGINTEQEQARYTVEQITNGEEYELRIVD